MSMKKIMAALLSLLLLATPCMAAQRVAFTQDPYPLPIAGGDAVSAQSLWLLGQSGDACLVYLPETGAVQRVSLADLNAIPGADLPELPDLDAASPLTVGDRGEGVLALQEGLAKLSYLSGKQDGIFGKNTARAVTAFQAASGLARQDGVADGATCALVEAMTAGEDAETLYIEWPVGAKLSMAHVFPEIADRVSVDLSPFMNGYAYRYDALEDAAYFTPNAAQTVAVDDAQAYNAQTFTISIDCAARATDAAGAMTVTPAMRVEAVGIRRPYLSGAQLILTGDDPARYLLSLSGAVAVADGAMMRETVQKELRGEGWAMLRRVAAADGATLTLIGGYKNYELTFDEAMMDSVRKIVQDYTAALG